jgi:hypothetical protein
MALVRARRTRHVGRVRDIPEAFHESHLCRIGNDLTDYRILRDPTLCLAAAAAIFLLAPRDLIRPAERSAQQPWILGPLRSHEAGWIGLDRYRPLRFIPIACCSAGPNGPARAHHPAAVDRRRLRPARHCSHFYSARSRREQRPGSHKTVTAAHIGLTMRPDGRLLQAVSGDNNPV